MVDYSYVDDKYMGMTWNDHLPAAFRYPSGFEHYTIFLHVDVWVDVFVVNVGSEGKEHFHRPLRIGPNSSRLRRILVASPLFYFEPRSFLAIVIQVLFSSWC